MNDSEHKRAPSVQTETGYKSLRSPVSANCKLALPSPCQMKFGTSQTLAETPKRTSTIRRLSRRLEMTTGITDSD